MRAIVVDHKTVQRQNTLAPLPRPLHATERSSSVEGVLDMRVRALTLGRIHGGQPVVSIAVGRRLSRVEGGVGRRDWKPPTSL